MTWEDRIAIGPCGSGGKTRLSRELDWPSSSSWALLAQGWTEAEVLRNYPGITREDILACLAYAQDRLQDRASLSGRRMRERRRCASWPMRTYPATRL